MACREGTYDGVYVLQYETLYTKRKTWTTIVFVSLILSWRRMIYITLFINSVCSYFCYDLTLCRIVTGAKFRPERLLVVLLWTVCLHFCSLQRYCWKSPSELCFVWRNFKTSFAIFLDALGLTFIASSVYSSTLSDLMLSSRSINRG